jgi:hypothetical protein
MLCSQICDLSHKMNRNFQKFVWETQSEARWNDVKILKNANQVRKS